MTTDLKANGEVLTARFAEKKAATLAASELFDLGFSSTELHIAFEGESLPEASEAKAPQVRGWQRLLEHLRVLSEGSGSHAETGVPPRMEASGATLILTVHASAQVREILNQHGAVLG